MNICVYSSSSNAIDEIYFTEARTLGRLIGEKGHSLINGGANVGLMEVVTLSTKQAGGKTIGIIPEKMIHRSLASDHAHEVIITDDMQSRKARMRDLSDAFIALPGGFGTLEEILEVLTLKQLAYHEKAIVFLNTNNFFHDLFAMFERFYTEMFAKENYRKYYHISETPEEALKYIENYIPEEIVNKWFQVPGNK